MKTSRMLAVVTMGVLLAAATVEADFIAVDGPNDQLTADNYCSLREAIRAAIEEDPYWSVLHGCVPGNGDDTIGLPDGVYYLSLGELEITGDVNNLKIEPVSSQSTPEDVILDCGSDRIAWVHFQTGDVTFERITFRGGTNMTSPDPRGGALLIEVVEVTLDTCVVRDSYAMQGGGAFLYEAVLTIDDSTFTGNYADSVTGGGFLLGGGIFADNSIVHATNSTFSYNNAAESGGALYLDSVSAAWLRHVTVTDNNCGFGDFMTGDGGGVFLALDADLNLAHTIIAGNHDLTNGATKHHDCGGAYGDPVSYNFNIVGDASGCGITAQPGDHFGTAGNLVDPGLAPLTTNVKGTESHLPLASGLAVGGGSFTTGINFYNCDGTGDQRGVTRPQCVNDPSICFCDIGAIELELTELIFADGFESGTTSAWN